LDPVGTRNGYYIHKHITLAKLLRKHPYQDYMHGTSNSSPVVEKTNNIQNVTHDVSQSDAVSQRNTDHQILDFLVLCGKPWFNNMHFNYKKRHMLQITALNCKIKDVA
jgi:hypothetical protein